MQVTQIERGPASASFWLCYRNFCKEAHIPCEAHLWRSELVERRKSFVLCTIWRACFSKLLLRASASSRRASRNLCTTHWFKII